MQPRERLRYSAIARRAPLRFPDGIRLVVWPVLALEEWDISRPMARMVISPPQGQPQLPDLPNWSWHEYGMRVGFWRLEKMLRQVGATPTVTLNARVCETYPEVVAACVDNGWELNAHSYDQVPMHKLDDQRGVIIKSMDIIGKFWGRRPRGWFGPGLTQTYETLDYLAEAGIEYIGDWVLDDEPVRLATAHGPVVALPYNFELHDIVLMALQHHPSDMMYRRALDHFHCLYEESAERAKIMAIACHPYLSGVPHRIGHVQRTYEEILRYDGVVTWDGAGFWIGISLSPGSSDSKFGGRMPAARPRSAFVPHDLAAPVIGNAVGPLAGLTAAVKDMYDIAGARTGGGSPDWLEAHAPAKSTAPVVRSILDAGATVIGKTVCDEFFFSVTGANAHYGTPLNPRAPGRLPGGSSSGSASATAAGACDFALGSDTGGSVRVPAAFCGIYGIRPTLGRIDLTGAMPMAPSFDVAGWFANGPGIFRRVGDLVLDRSTQAAAPIEQLIVLEDAFAQADADVARLLESILGDMASGLPKARRDRVAPDGSLDPWRESFRIIQAGEVWSNYGTFVERHRPNFGPGIRERMEFAATVSARDVEKAREQHVAAHDRIRSMVPAGIVLALPTAPCVAPRLDAAMDELESFRLRVMRLTCIAGLSGLPQVTLPVGSIGGCPVGLSFIGWAGSDETLLSLCVALARFCGNAG